MRSLCALFIAVVTLGGLTVSASAEQTIAQIVSASGGEFDDNRYDFDILLTAVGAADLVDTLNDPGAELTVFAPADFAFIALARDLGYTGGDEAGTWDFLVTALAGLSDDGDPIPVLRNVLLYHVAAGDITFFDVIIYSIFRIPVDTELEGATFQPKFFQLIDNAPALRNPFLWFPFDVSASNGRIHTIGRVLIPIDIP